MKTEAPTAFERNKNCKKMKLELEIIEIAVYILNETKMERSHREAVEEALLGT